MRSSGELGWPRSRPFRGASSLLVVGIDEVCNASCGAGYSDTDVRAVPQETVSPFWHEDREMLALFRSLAMHTSVCEGLAHVSIRNEIHVGVQSVRTSKLL
jgi:hypothetical protein